ncbi:MAG: hypothetical protein P1P88_06230, partial [Bacteroidales bacterium]|nr:hypothetical protein [Bacteroidales bacterium]
MDKNEFKKSLERQIHKSLFVLFEKANLTKKEQEIFLKYKKDCEYWLLRSKVQYSQPFLASDTNFIKQIAIVLINLQSDRVFGAKNLLIKKMFADNSVHRFKETKGGGIRSTVNSPIIFNTYYELEILSFFLKNDYKIQLASDKIRGMKIPEFVAEKDNIRINIEAKSLDADSIGDSIFGNVFITGTNYKKSKEDLEKGYIRISDQLKRNYEKAIGKYNEIEAHEYFIIFINPNYRIKAMGKPSIDYLNQLKDEWGNDKYNRLIGVVIHDSDNTFFIRNKYCEHNVIKKIEEMGISE